MKIVNIDRLHAQVAAALRSSWSAINFGAMEWHPAANVALAQYSRFHIFVIKVCGGVRGHVRIRRQESALGATQQFLARIAAPRKFRQSCAYGAFRALKPIVDRRVDHVHAGLHSLDDCVCVRLVGARIRLPEIRSNPQRGKPQATLLAKMSRRGAPRKSLGIFFRSIRCRECGHSFSFNPGRDCNRCAWRGLQPAGVSSCQD